MKKSERNKRETTVNLTAKPFCDCAQCKCKHCPDIRELFPTFDRKPKNNEKSIKKISIRNTNVSQDSKEVDLSLMTFKKNNRDCNCEVLARALRSNVHLNLNLSKQTPKD